MKSCQLKRTCDARAPNYLLDRFSVVDNQFRRSVRQQNLTEHVPSDELALFVIPSTRTEPYKRSFEVSAARAWNSLPLTIRKIDSLETFKNSLNKYLLEQERAEFPTIFTE